MTEAVKPPLRAARVMRWHDQELGDEERAEIEAWLAEDAQARAELADLRLLGELVREVDAAQLPEVDLADGVLQRLAQAEPALPAAPRSNVRALPRRALAGAAAVLAAAAAVSLLWFRGAEDALTPESDVAAPVAAISAPEPEPPGESVAVERVDFGAAQGAIFLVPGTEARTVVIWTMDDSVDAEQGEEIGL